MPGVDKLPHESENTKINRIYQELIAGKAYLGSSDFNKGGLVGYDVDYFIFSLLQFGENLPKLDKLISLLTRNIGHFTLLLKDFNESAEMRNRYQDSTEIMEYLSKSIFANVNALNQLTPLYTNRLIEMSRAPAAVIQVLITTRE